MKTVCGKKPLTFGEFIARVYEVCGPAGRDKATGIVRLAIKAHLIEFRGQQRFVIFQTLQPRSKDMNTLLETPARETQTPGRRRENIPDARPANRNAPNQGRPAPLWLKARAWTIGFRHDDLVQTHWTKVCRSMRDD